MARAARKGRGGRSSRFTVWMQFIAGHKFMLRRTQMWSVTAPIQKINF
ncbi:protein of unassigned function [Methylobacterium oryzae CBMB20]|uniref:Protein of unassigned function n=1 Tax=Methylobacterium oryzae CBMB20 TaxID=693986 RepID=A0A089NZR0_9HYPH|nr:protein of unassigned function [Methylobacterium oryzae CBMB20]